MEVLIETTAPQKLSWNFEEMKKAALAKAAEYQNIVYTDKAEAQMKADKAELNRIINQVEDERKRLKKEAMAPYLAWEAEVKEVLDPLRKAVAGIEKGLSEIESKYRRDKETFMRSLYEREYADFMDTVPFDRTVREEYFKKAFTDRKLEKAYCEEAARVRTDLVQIFGMDQKYQTAAVHAYMKALTMADAQAEVFRMKEMDEALERRRQAERARAEELRLIREQREAEQKKQEEEARAAEAAKPEPVPAPTPAPAPEPVPIPAEAVKEEPTISYGPIYIFGTRAQLMAMGQWLKDNGLTCRRA